MYMTLEINITSAPQINQYFVFKEILEYIARNYICDTWISLPSRNGVNLESRWASKLQAKLYTSSRDAY